MKFILGLISGASIVLLAALIAPLPDGALDHLQNGEWFGLRVAATTAIATVSMIFGLMDWTKPAALPAIREPAE